jgi:hypothetical protein
MSPCLKPNRERDHLERGLNELTRRRVHRDDTDLIQFAARLRSETSSHLATTTRNDIWHQVLSYSTPPKAPHQPLGISAPSRANGTTTRGWNLRGMIIPRSLPAPAVLLFGVLIALIVALSGFGHDGHEMVTPTAYAQQAATAIASPASPEPTSTLTISDNS